MKNPKRLLAEALAEKSSRARYNRLGYYQPYPKQAEFHALGKTIRERLLSAANQVGKEQPVDEPVLTPSGWKAIGALRVGDEVIAGDGSITKVIGVFPQGIKPVWRFEFGNGEWTRAGLEHLWQVTLPNHRHEFRWSHDGKERNTLHGTQSVVTTQELIERFYRDGKTPRPKQRVVMPHVVAVEFSARSVEVDPYLLGVLLGDGCLRNGMVSVSTADEEILEWVEAALPDGVAIKKSSSRQYDYYLTTNLSAQANGWYPKNSLKTALSDLGVYGKLAHEKSVPESYLLNESSVRLAVLQGLMDTDGSVAEGGAIEFCSTSRKLAEDVQFLVRSFGGRAAIQARTTHYVYGGERKAGRESYRVLIRLPQVEPFRLRRKLDRLVRPVSTCDEHVLYRIVPDGEAECVCIAVEHPSHLYVTRDFIVTHNTWSMGFETAMHLTGRYPDWWEGHAWDKPVVYYAASVSAELTREGMQRVLFGRAGDASALGTGAIPREAIIETSPRPGTPNAFSQAVIRWGGGGDVQARHSTLILRSYEQGREKFQADTVDGFWFDEEPPFDIYMEGLTRTNRVRGPVCLTFTPLLGMSETVKRFFIEKPPGTGIVKMGLKDALHYTDADIEAIVAQYPEHERKARVYGEPVLGSGAVYPLAIERITIPAFEIPSHWRRICGIDIGWDHPTTAVWLAIDDETETVYVYDCYKASKLPVSQHAASIKARGSDIPVAWPHDALQTQKDTGVAMRDAYRREGLSMLPERAQFEDGSYGVEAGVQLIFDKMLKGQFKVMAHLLEWFEEFRLYHRDAGKIVKTDDDLMDATRYAFMSLRFAQSQRIQKLNIYRSSWRA